MDTPEHGVEPTIGRHEDQRVLSVILDFKHRQIPITALYDPGATGLFMDSDFCRRAQLPIRRAPNQNSVRAGDGHPIHDSTLEPLYETHPLPLTIGQFSDHVCFTLIRSPDHPVILGMPYFVAKQAAPTPNYDKLVFPNGTLVEMFPLRNKESLERVDVQMLAAIDFAHESQGQFLYAAIVTPADLKTSPNPTGVLPDKYSQFSDIFSEQEATKLPPHRPYDCEIELLPGTTPPFKGLYNLSPTELEALREYLVTQLDKGWIRHSTSSAGAPIIFFKKPDGSLRVAIDYRGLNSITAKNKYPLPLISELLDRLKGAKIFTKLDLRVGYNNVRIREGDEWKTAFRTRYGLFEYLVMPLGLTNAPAAFQHFMNDVFRDVLDDFVVIYLDDILIFSRDPRDHERHVRLVLQRLRDQQLFCKLEKCSFEQSSVVFLGFVISPEGLSMDSSKIQSIKEWKAPSSLRDVQVFLGFAQFYRRFIRDFAKIAKPLTDLTRTTLGTPFTWTSAADAAFETLKFAFCSAPVLVHVDFDRPFVVETDASDFAIGMVLSQPVSNSKDLHPVAFHSRKLSPAEINYDTFDKEALAVYEAMTTWRHYLEGSPHPIMVYTDHANLQYLTSTRTLSRREARWALYLSQFKINLVVRPGRKNGKADALSRRPEYELAPDDPLRLVNTRPLVNPVSAQDPDEHVISSISIAAGTFEFLDKLRSALETDERARTLRTSLFSDTRREDTALWEEEEGLLTFKGLLYIPTRDLQLEILRTRHDSKSAGHLGTTKTYDLIARDFWWPTRWKDVKNYVRTCDVCARSKAPRHAPFGLLQRMPIPSRNWQSISMDFITKLPVSSGFDSILVIVDRLSRGTHLEPCQESMTAKQVGHLYLKTVYRHHGLPDTIVSDRDTKFVAHFWRELHKLFNTKLSMSSAFHPQTDGMPENKNQVIEAYLRSFVSYHQDDWVDLLPFCEVAINNSQSTATGHSPFYLNYGFNPRFDFLPRREPTVAPAAEEFVRHLEEISKEAQLELQQAQELQAKYADRHRLPTPDFKIGDNVWLLRRNIKTSRPSDKLDFKRLGPYPIEAKINPVAFKLKLPFTLKIHPVFHVSLLEPYHADASPDRHQPPPPPITVENQLEFEVKEILDSRIRYGKLQYLVDWDGYDVSERTWEPVAHVANSPEAVQAFHARYPDKPGPVVQSRARGRAPRKGRMMSGTRD